MLRKLSMTPLIRRTLKLHHYQRRARAPAPHKTKPPALSVSGSRRLSYFYLVLYLPLCLNDARRDEEDQFLVGGADRGVLEQVAQVRDVAQQRHLGDVDRVLSLDHTTDDHRATVGHEDLGGCLLGDQRRVALDR